MTAAIPETEILMPRDPCTDDNTDEWPEFVLNHVNIHLPDDHDAATSLLEASVGYPLTVEGQLQPLDEEDAHLYRQLPAKKRVKIMLENVKTFSYGQYGDGTAAIWAAGQAGWFNIKPSRSYTPMYNSMVDAVNLIYFVADSYRKPRKKGKGRNAIVLPDYTVQELFEKYAAEELGSSDPLDAMDKFYEHQDFIMSSMISGKEGLAWSRLPIYRHFYKKFPDAFAKLRRRLEGRLQDDESKFLKVKARQGRRDSMDSNSTTNPAKRRRRPQRNAADVISVDDHSDVQDSSVQAVSEEPELSKAGPPRKPVSRRTRKHSAVELTPEVENEIVLLVRDDDETDDETKLRARKNKSSLRPRASKATKSAVRREGKRPFAEDEDELEQPTSPLTGKRRFTEDADTQRASKRRSSRPHDDEGIDVPLSPSSSGNADDSESPTSTNSPPGKASERALRNLGHIPDPVQEDTWVCALDGCNHKVYAASNPDSQRLIKEHYTLHAYDDDERVQMVKSMQAPSLPASHLMERVKMQAKMDGFPASVSRQMASRYPITLPPLTMGVRQRY